MAIVDIYGKPSFVDIFKSLDPADFHDSTSVTTTATSIDYHFDEGLDDYSIEKNHAFTGIFSYTYGSNSQIKTVTVTVTSLSYTYSYDEFSGGSDFYENFSIHDVNINVADFMTTFAVLIAKILAGDDVIYGSSAGDLLERYAGDDVSLWQGRQ